MARARSTKSSNNNSANVGFEQKLSLAADKLRNNMDAAEYKHVVLGLIFLKYISDSSGGMFVQSEKFVEAHGGKLGDISIYGQESNATTRRLAVMNLAMRGIEADFGPEHADTFRRDLHPDLRADYVLANPPFNDSDWFRKDDDVRWQYGVPPRGNANFAWVQHFIHPVRVKTSVSGFVKTAPKRKSVQKRSHRFGGRATAVGVGYEAQVAASIAVKMLGGDRCVVWDGIDGSEIAAITMQDAEPVDDVVLALCRDVPGKVFISAKHRAGTVALTAKSAAFAEVVTSFVRQFFRLAPNVREGSRFMWAVPSSAGAGLTRDLRKVLDIFREDNGTSINAFLERRQPRERKAMAALVAQANSVDAGEEETTGQRGT